MKKTVFLLLISVLGFTSDLLAQDWVQMNGPSVPSPVIALIADSNGMLVTSIFSSNPATFRSLDGGSSWFSIVDSFRVSIPYWFVVDSIQDIIGGNLIIVRLAKGEQAWSQAYQPEGNIRAGIVLPNHTIIIMTDDGGESQSTDNGLTWNYYKGPGPTYSLALNSSGDIFAGGVFFVYRSQDKGKTWSTFPLDKTLTLGSAVTCLATDLYGDIYAYFYRYGIYRSFDNGETWSLFVDGLPGKRDLVIRSMTSAVNGTIFIGTDSGVFRHDITACNWTPYSQGLTTEKVLSLAYDKEGRLYAGSDSGGVFRSRETFNSIPKLTGRILVDDIFFDTKVYGQTICNNITIRNVGLTPFTLEKNFTVVDHEFSVDPQSAARLPLVIKPKDSVSLTICFHASFPGNFASEIDWSTDIVDSICTPLKYQSFLHGVAIENSAVRNAEPEIQFSVHPNPSSGSSVIVTLGGVSGMTDKSVRPTELSMFDVLGREVYHRNILSDISQIEIPISDLSEGIYYIKLSSASSSVSQKFVKEK